MNTSEGVAALQLRDRLRAIADDPHRDPHWRRLAHAAWLDPTGLPDLPDLSDEAVYAALTAHHAHRCRHQVPLTPLDQLINRLAQEAA